MKYDKAWVERMAQCSDGLTWGLEYVKSGGKDLQGAVKGFDRADFLLWFLVKAFALPIESAFDLLVDLSNSRLDHTNAFSVRLTRGDAEVLRYLRGHYSAESETLMTTGNFRGGHASASVAFLARMRLRILENDPDEALKDGQCVVNNLVAARTGSLDFHSPEAKQEHAALCEWLNSRVIVSGGRRV